ncbi:MAG TPA: hypothetical protein GXX15_09395 [Clostridia bacterium]|nr:hypothetical protein [Clostridia bacterium]
MFSSDNLESQVKDLLSKLGLKESGEGNDGDKGEDSNKNGEKDKQPNSGGGNGNGNGEEESPSGGEEKKKGVLTPSQIMVILAILSGALEPISIIVDRNQNVQVVLSGTLREIIPVPSEKGQPSQNDSFLDNAIKALLAKE